MQVIMIETTQAQNKFWAKFMSGDLKINKIWGNSILNSTETMI